MAQHERLSEFFQDFLVQDRLINICVLGDSMSADNTGNIGQMTSSILSSWEPPARSDGTSGWVGQGGMCPLSGSGLISQQTQGVPLAAGGVISQQQPDTLTGVSNQYFGRNLWALAAARTVGINMFAGFARDRQQIAGTSNAPGSFKLGSAAEPYNNQYCQARVSWRNHVAGPPSGALEVCATRRSTAGSFNTIGSDVGAASPIDMATGTGIGSITVNCGNGSGEPGYRMTTLATNLAINEAAYLCNHAFFRKSGAGYADYPGASVSAVAVGGFNTQDLLKCLGGTTITGADGNTTAISPYCSAADSQTLIANMHPTGGPTHWVIRLGQNLTVSDSPNAQNNENTFLDAGNPACLANHYLDVINRCRTISFNLNGSFPKILLISPINTRETPSLLNRQTRSVAGRIAVSVYGNSFYDAWGETYPSLIYGNVINPWYGRAGVDSTSTDGVHESSVGAWCNARFIWEEGMRSLGLDPGVRLGGQNRKPLNINLRNRNI